MESVQNTERNSEDLQSTSKEKTLCSLPILVQSRILSFLSGISINSLCRSSRSWRKIIVDSPKQCRKTRFKYVNVKSYQKKFTIKVKDEEGTSTSKEIQIMKEEKTSEPSSKRRKTEDDKKQNEDVKSSLTPEILKRLEKIAKIGDVKRLSLDSIDLTEESIDRIVEIFGNVEEIEVSFMDFQKISNEKVRKLFFGLGNTKLDISFTWVSSQLIQDSFWEKCGEKLEELYLDNMNVKDRMSGVPIIKEEEFIQLCNRIPSIRFGVVNEIKSDTFLRIIETSRLNKKNIHYKIDYHNQNVPLQLSFSFFHNPLLTSSEPFKYSDHTANLTVNIDTNTETIEITRQT